MRSPLALFMPQGTLRLFYMLHLGLSMDLAEDRASLLSPHGAGGYGGLRL